MQIKENRLHYYLLLPPFTFFFMYKHFTWQSQQHPFRDLIFIIRQRNQFIFNKPSRMGRRGFPSGSRILYARHLSFVPPRNNLPGTITRYLYIAGEYLNHICIHTCRLGIPKHLINVHIFRSVPTERGRLLFRSALTWM